MSSWEHDGGFMKKRAKRTREERDDSCSRVVQEIFCILDLVDEAILLLDTDSRQILFMNRSLERFLGLKRTDLIFSPLPSSLFQNGEADLQQFYLSAKQATLPNLSTKEDPFEDPASLFYIDKDFQMKINRQSAPGQSKESLSPAEPTPVFFYSFNNFLSKPDEIPYRCCCVQPGDTRQSQDVCCIFKTKPAPELSCQGHQKTNFPPQRQGTEAGRVHDQDQHSRLLSETPSSLSQFQFEGYSQEELSNPDFMNYLKVFSECAAPGMVMEYLPEVNDISIAWANTQCAKRYRAMIKNPEESSSLIGKCFKRDIGYPPTEVDVWIERLKDLFALAEANRDSPDLVKVERVYEDTVLMPNGDTRQFIGHNYVLDAKLLGTKTANQHPYTSLVVAEDITDMRRTLFKLEHEAKMCSELAELCFVFKLIFDHSPLSLGLVELVDNDTDIIWRFNNKKPLFDVRHPESSLKGLRASEVGVPPETISLWVTRYRESEKTAQPVQFEINDWQETDVWASACVMHVVQNQFIYVVQNITQLRILEAAMMRHGEELAEKVKERTKQLEEALEVKSRFLATMSHEIRTPLTGIIGALGLLASTQMTEDQCDLVNIIKVCGQQLLVVVSDVLDLSKLEDGKVTLDRAPVHLRESIEESLGIVVIEAGRQKIELISDLDMNLPTIILGDEGRLRQVLGNLLNNAVKFSRSNSTIVVGASLKDTSEEDIEIVVYVEDQGIGIPESAKPKIFQPFVQADNSVARRYGGSGLGLAVCKRLVERMGGKIWFTSEEGRGSTFYLSVPVKRSDCSWENPHDSTPQRKEEMKMLIGKTALLIDSNSRALEACRKMLEYWKMKSICCNTISQSFQYIPEADIVVVDLKENQEEIEKLKGSMKPLGVMTGSEETSYAYPVLRKPLRQSALLHFLVSQFIQQEQAQPLPEVVGGKSTASVTAVRKCNSAKSPNSIRILVAEDNPSNQKVVQRLLNNLGYKQVEIVDNGLQCIESMRKHCNSPDNENRYDLILMDVMMPEMGGIEATEKIRRELHEEVIPIVALTADVFPENRECCLRAGMNSVLTKPIKLSELRTALEQYLPNK